MLSACLVISDAMKSMMRPTETSVKSAIASHCELKIQEFAASIKRPRTTDDFLRFCDVVLSYANYPDAFGSRDGNDRKLDSPLNSIGESTHPSATSSASSRSSSIGEADIYTGTDVEDYCDEDNWEQVTCWCGKPFAGRPMIECESCFVWIHLSCARVRKSNIPKHFKCAKCKPVSGRRKRVFSENSDLDLVSADRSEPSSPISGLNGKACYSETPVVNESKKRVKRKKNSVGGSGDMSSFRDRYQSSSPMNSFEFKESLSSNFTDVDDESSQYQVMSSNKTSALPSLMPRSRSEERLLGSSKKIQSRRSAPSPQHSLKKASQNTHSSGHPADNPLAVRLVANYSTNYLSD